MVRDIGGKQVIESEVEFIIGGDLGFIGKLEICMVDELYYVVVLKIMWCFVFWCYCFLKFVRCVIGLVFVN